MQTVKDKYSIEAAEVILQEGGNLPSVLSAIALGRLEYVQWCIWRGQYTPTDKRGMYVCPYCPEMTRLLLAHASEDAMIYDLFLFKPLNVESREGFRQAVQILIDDSHGKEMLRRCLDTEDREMFIDYFRQLDVPSLQLLLDAGVFPCTWKWPRFQASFSSVWSEMPAEVVLQKLEMVHYFEGSSESPLVLRDILYAALKMKLDDATEHILNAFPFLRDHVETLRNEVRIPTYALSTDYEEVDYFGRGDGEFDY